MGSERVVGKLGSQYLTSYVDSVVAVGRWVQGRFPEVSEPLDKAHRGLAKLARASQLPQSYLERNTVAGNLILSSRTVLGLAGVEPLNLAEMKMVLDTGRAEGQLFVSVTVGMWVAVAQSFGGDQAGALQELEVIADEAKAVGASFFLAQTNLHAAAIRHEQGDIAGAKALLTATEPVASGGGSHYTEVRFHRLAGTFAMAEGDVVEAERRAHRCLSLACTGDFGWEGAMGLELLAEVAVTSGSFIEAVRLAAAADRLREDRAIRIHLASDRDRSAAALTICREALGGVGFDAAWAEGYALSMTEAVEYAQRARGERKRPALGWESLTPTERLVVEQVELGLTNPQIAEKLLISRDTVKTHLSHVFTKLNVKSRSELAAAAARRPAPPGEQ